ncbi:MAG TPA: response regulator [Methylocella sp.]|nr:response regulator [Methylocella sp.]
MARLLIVDDEPLVAELLLTWLADLECEVAGPADGVESALRLLSEGQAVDGAILDVTLADGDSYPIADALRSRGIPFAFATGHDHAEFAERFDGVLTLPKPFSFEDVQKTVAHLLAAGATCH